MLIYLIREDDYMSRALMIQICGAKLQINFELTKFFYYNLNFLNRNTPHKTCWKN